MLCRLKDKGRVFREAFLGKLQLLLRGTVMAPPERFGETIEEERIRGGASPVIAAQPSCNLSMASAAGSQLWTASDECRK